MKIPQYLQRPSDDWRDLSGMLRAIAVLKIQAYHLRKRGLPNQSSALLEVAEALKASINSWVPVAESETLGWEITEKEKKWTKTP